MSRRRSFVWTLPLACGISVAVLAPQPSFRSGTDVLLIDATVLDREGRPIVDLTERDFEVRLDGKARRIVSVQFLGSPSVQSAADPAALSAGRSYTSNVDAALVRPNLIVIVVDQGNITPGNAMSAVRAAAQFVDGLAPQDRVALVALPAPGARIEFTTDRERVRKAGMEIVGRATRMPGMFTIGVAEALQIAKDDSPDEDVFTEVVARECAGDRDCPQRLRMEARMKAMSLLNNATVSWRALIDLVKALQAVPAPKTLLLLSEGLIADAIEDDVARLSEAAAAASVTVHALHIESFPFDVTERTITPGLMTDRRISAQGLDLVAGATRGTVLPLAGDPSRAFSRLANELRGTYWIGVEAERGDRDDRYHRIRVDVARPGTTVRARHGFSARAPKSAPSREASLAELLASPLPATEVPLAATTYTFRDAATGRLRALLAAETGPPAAAGNLIGLRVVSGDGKVIAHVTTAAGSTYTAAVVLDPAQYLLKAAVIDARGRRGTVEHSFEAKLHGTPELQTSELLFAAAGPNATAAVIPTFHGPVAMSLQLYPAAGVRPADVRVTFEIARGGAETVLTRMEGTLTPAPTHQTAGIVFDASGLDGGEYVASAVVQLAGRHVARVMRSFTVRPPAGAALHKDASLR